MVRVRVRVRKDRLDIPCLGSLPSLFSGYVFLSFRFGDGFLEAWLTKEGCPFALATGQTISTRAQGRKSADLAAGVST